jgi:Subtilase family
MKLRQRIGALLCATLFMLVVFGGEAYGVGLEVRLLGDRLSLNAEQVSLQEILLHLSDYGIRIQIDPQINPAVTASFENRDIQKALESILKGLDHVLIWGSETKSGFLSEALESASSKGLIIVASAGNDPTGEPRYPAAYPGVIGVGALAPDGEAWERSNRGDFVDLYAPGFATLPVGYKGDPGIYAGTSISAAFTANLVAGILSKNPNATGQEILDNLRKKR